MGAWLLLAHAFSRQLHSPARLIWEDTLSMVCALSGGLRTWTCCLLGATWCQTGVQAADFRLDIKADHGPAVIFVTGQIVDTDRARMEKALEDIARAKPKSEVVLALHSPGGDHYAGLRIALLVQRKGVGTVILPRATCLSACSSIFFGGFDRKRNQPNRTVFEGGRLGASNESTGRGRPVDRAARDARGTLSDLKVSKAIKDRVFSTPPNAM